MDMKRTPYFILSISTVSPGEVAVINKYTGDFAKQSLKSMKKIKREFKSFLNSKETMTFSFMRNKETIAKLQSMLPVRYLYY